MWFNGAKVATQELVVGHGFGYQSPELGAMIHLAQVAKLVDDNIVLEMGGKKIKTVVKT